MSRRVKRMADKYILSDESPFIVREAYKTLRTNIIFALPDSGGKAIGFTSSHRSERKSSNCINVALSFAEIGKKCVIVDCDMRLPTVAKRLEVKAFPGVSNILIGESKISEAVSHYAENVDVIPAGRIPKDPTGLLSSQIMTEFMSALKANYDYVFVDLPPVNTVTDAAIISKNIDGYLLVTRNEDSQYKELADAIKLLRMSSANIIGTVYNDAPISTKKYYSKYYKNS